MKLSLLILALALFSQNSAADMYKFDDDTVWTNPSCSSIFGLKEISEGDEVSLHATNLSEHPITFTLKVRTKNLFTMDSHTTTKTLYGSESMIVMRFEKVGDKHNFAISCNWWFGDKDAKHDKTQAYLLPYEKGKSYVVVQGTGSNFSHYGLEHFAVDFKMDVGTPVHAARDGVAVKIEESHDKGCWDDGCGAYANYLVVLHDDGTTSEYFHLKKDGVLVEVGDAIVAGQKIALSGNTGHTTIPHLHFAVYRPISWGRTESLPVRYSAEMGIVHDLRRGSEYVAISLFD